MISSIWFYIIEYIRPYTLRQCISSNGNGSTWSYIIEYLRPYTLRQCISSNGNVSKVTVSDIFTKKCKYVKFKNYIKSASMHCMYTILPVSYTHLDVYKRQS